MPQLLQQVVRRVKRWWGVCARAGARRMCTHNSAQCCSMIKYGRMAIWTSSLSWSLSVTLTSGTGEGAHPVRCVVAHLFWALCTCTLCATALALRPRSASWEVSCIKHDAHDVLQRAINFLRGSILKERPKICSTKERDISLLWVFHDWFSALSCSSVLLQLL